MSLTGCGALLAGEIARQGPIPFSRFMEVALYHPAHGYYTRGRDPFGREGDYFTAAQLQPVFGRLVASLLRREVGPGATVADWGAGRGEMAAAMPEFNWISVRDPLTAPPAPFSGVVFANELFDALPVGAAARRSGQWIELRVDARDGAFVWTDYVPLAPPWLDYAHGLSAAFGADRDLLIELPVRLEETVDLIGRSLAGGILLAIDYGYTDAEAARFPGGTLMGYRRHRAVENVLGDPGGKDITAHVPFDHLRRLLLGRGWKELRFETLAAMLLRAGEQDQFSAALRADSEAEALRLRLQLKTLLFGLGETFRALWMAK
jgi:SAM-dependent MidA family methyltransferase